MQDERLLRATRAMKLKDYDTAMKLLSQEAADKPDGFIVFDLRAACCLHSGKHEQALDDAMQCTKLNPEWARGWARLGAAQLCMGHMRASVSAYRQGLELDPASSEMQLGLKMAQQAQAAVPQDRRKAMHHI
ncbi:hypothetical protein D9Q98_004853 [Chlorella vulgaris]|uniref:Uncharacterized protein n=1 Tax=Chlorella vulgaris TaxID=3077 RepID=A0A9D4YWI3_CHLVU|nr:hypothetical protein D9Q98_004853 [Chlorella vulgaris]